MKNPIKNQGGSALAYVLIFSVIIMVLVVGLLTVAQSGISFTQQTVESRQAYIDAKSVIEYGKIEINAWQRELSAAYDNLVAVLNDEDSTETDIQAARAVITTLENRTYSIYGDETNVSTSLNLSGSGSQEILGNVFLEKTEVSIDATDTSNYIFKVETQNLRRTLDYQVSYDYDLSDESGSGGSSPIKPTKPNINNLLDPDSEWAGTVLTAKEAYGGTWAVPKCFINGVDTGSISDGTLYIGSDTGEGGQDLKITHYDWNNSTKLNLTANNALVDNDLAIIDGDDLTITCDTFYIQGDLSVNYPSGSLANITINANNIVIEGNLEVGSYSNVTINCPNIWIDGDIYTASTQAVLEFESLNYLKAGDINLSDDCDFSVTGADINSSQFEVGSIISYESNEYDLSLTNLWSFTCTGLELNDNSTLDINSNIVLIDGDFTLGPQAGNNTENSLLIETQYFDCTGFTTIDDLKGDFLIKRIDYDKSLYVRFAGGYEQTRSNSNYGVSIGEVKDKQDNNSEVVKNAKMIVFGGTIIIPNDNVYLNLYADKIYFDSDDIQVEDNTNFYFSGEPSATNDFTDFFIRNEITDTDKDVIEGSYYSVKGDFRWNRFNSNDVPDYVYPSFPNPPGSSGGSSTVTSSRGNEKYY